MWATRGMCMWKPRVVAEPCTQDCAPAATGRVRRKRRRMSVHAAVHKRRGSTLQKQLARPHLGTISQAEAHNLGPPLRTHTHTDPDPPSHLLPITHPSHTPHPHSSPLKGPSLKSLTLQLSHSKQYNDSLTRGNDALLHIHLDAVHHAAARPPSHHPRHQTPARAPAPRPPPAQPARRRIRDLRSHHEP